jgi:hypothetical protein
MISVIHASQNELIAEDEDFLIPAGGRRMEMDWERVTAAFQSAVEQLGWDADLEIRPEKQYVMVRFSTGCPDVIAEAMDEFYDFVEESIGSDAFMSIWVDFAFRSPANV